jgi:phosphatidylserine/phosphatidylglycerophosphate/cardiolipin synthase-like enzyme
MDADPTPVDEPRTAAVEQLEEFGLSAYAARTFVALVSLGTGTAKDVSRIADVPRTRVYGAVEELQERGLVDVQQSSPKEFWAISAGTAGRKFEREMDHRTSILRTALGELEPSRQSEEQRGVWTVDGQAAVTDRVVEFIEGADDEIVYMTVEELLTDDIVDALGAAAARGVTVHLGGVSPGVQERIREEVPGANLFESLWVWSDTPAGRLAMIDGTRTLVSVLVNGADESPAAPRDETAIWGAGTTNSLVVVLRAIFTWRLQDAEDGGMDEG